MSNSRSRGRIFVEDVLRLRIKPRPNNMSQLPVANPGETLSDDIVDGSTISNMSDLNQFRTMSSDREARYKIFDEMATDSVIASALEMYADDATQYNSKGQVIWAESDDQNISAFANRLIDILDLNKNAWSHIYSMVKYGDLYLETFKDDEIDEDPLVQKPSGYSNISIIDNKKGAKMEEYIEAVPNPAELFDIVRRGKTVGFIKTESNEIDPLNPTYTYRNLVETDETVILPPDKYVHIALSNNTDRFPETLTLSFKDDKVESGLRTHTYNVKRGKSILHDIYRIYREIKLMEDSLLLNRVTRSSIIRLLQVEVGDMPKSQARELLKRIKQLVEQKNYMDKNDGTYNSMASPGPIDNVVYIPTHDGKGQITSSNLGGDVDVKSIVDIDYFKNKLYGGIKIPKQFLGDTDDAAGFSGGTSLTKLDSRYARTIKRIQNAYISGIETLINLFAISKGLQDHVNAFTIKMVSPSTIEDQERDEMLENKMGMIGTLMDLINNDELSDAAIRKEIFIYLMNNYLNEPEISEMLSRVNTDDNSEDDETDSEDPAGDTSFDDFGDFDDFDAGFDTDIDDASTDDIEDTDTMDDTENPPSDEEGFGDFSDEA